MLRHIFIITSLLLLTIFITMWKNILIYQDKTHFKLHALYEDMIQTGDIFLVKYKRKSQIFGDALMKIDFIHPVLAIKGDEDVYMIEWNDRFGVYRGTQKIPFRVWSRMNKNSTILWNRLENPPGNSDFRKNLRDSIDDSIQKAKKRFGGLRIGFSPYWIRFLFPNWEYDSSWSNNITCLEVVVKIMRDSGLIIGNETLHSHQPSHFIGMRGFDLAPGVKYSESRMVKIPSLLLSK